jgi:hypothetical protein
MQYLATFLLSITGSVAARVLTALGIGIISYAALSTLANQAVSAAETNYYSIQATVLALINMGGIGKSLGILTSALITKATMLAIKKFRPL